MQMQKTDMIKILANLIQLEFDTVHVYDTAIEGVGDDQMRHRLESFRQTHHAHTEDLAEAIKKLGEDPPAPARDLKGIIFEKLTAIRSKTGTEGALKALRTAEDILSRHYHELVPENTPKSTNHILKKHLSDGQVHLDYIDLNIKALSITPPG